MRSKMVEQIYDLPKLINDAEAFFVLFFMLLSCFFHAFSSYCEDLYAVGYDFI